MISRAAPHMWEEPVISGTRGSGTIFFGGCGLGCVFCQNYEISSCPAGKATAPQELAEIMQRLEGLGVHNISFVTGTHFAKAIIQALNIYRPKVPIVWNSSGYENVSTLRALSDYVDIWLPDYKFALPEVAEKYASAVDYPKVALEAIKFMCEACGENLIEDGVMKRGVIVRHLVMPNNVRNSVAVLRSIDKNLPSGTMVSIMSQYIPAGDISNYSELSRRITEREYNKVCSVADLLGIEGFVQDMSAADGKYVPDFAPSNEL